MEDRAPQYYTRLRPFRRLFATGVPILTYHKLGRTPRGARLKGLYVSVELFARQLAELRQGGFGSGHLLEANRGPDPEHPRVVITFDDGCTSVLQHGLGPLAQHGFRATVFLVAGLLGRTSEWETGTGEVLQPLMDVTQVREWLAAGHEIGSHTLTHPWLTRLPAPQAREEIRASKHKLEDTFGLPIRHFCYPYGDWNVAIRDLAIEAGYATACTVDFGVNDARTHPCELCRLTARYASRKLRNVVPWLLGRV